jgi:dihydroxy-acid dehydratase
VGGPIGLLKNGDVVTIDAEKRLISVDLSAKEFAARRKKWRAPKPNVTEGWLARYAALVSSGSEGAVLKIPGA